jgi:hypothetical protein
MADQPFALELADRLKLLLGRDLGVDPVELPQIDPLQPESPQASFQLAAEEFRPAILDPLVGARSLETAFRRDDQPGIGAPKPIRLTMRSPPRVMVPAEAAGRAAGLVVVMGSSPSSKLRHRLRGSLREGSRQGGGSRPSRTRLILYPIPHSAW